MIDMNESQNLKSEDQNPKQKPINLADGDEGIPFPHGEGFSVETLKPGQWIEKLMSMPDDLTFCLRLSPEEVGEYDDGAFEVAAERILRHMDL